MKDNIEYLHPYTGKELVALPLINPLVGEYLDIPSRGFSKSICEKWKVLALVNYCGERALAFTYLSSKGALAGYHIKPTSKECRLVGNIKDAAMYGSWLMDEPTGRTLVITEGHEDAISCSMVLPPSYHCTSLKYGCNSVDDFIKVHYHQLLRYSSVVICFDEDEPGGLGRDTFLRGFNQIGKIRIAKLPLKDASDMVQAGRTEELKWAILKAETFKPQQIVSWDDITPGILTKPEIGRPWPWKAMNDITHGFYPGKTYCIGSATSVGKTTFVKDLVFNFIEQDPKLNVGCFFLEQKPVEVAHKLLSSKVGYDLEQPDTQWWDKDRLKEEIQGLKKHIFLFDPTQGIELQEVINSIYYFVNVNKVQAVIIDNLTILSENRMIDGKRVSEMDYLNEVAKQFNRIKRELNVSFFIICHLSQDKISKTAYVTTSPKNFESYTSTTSEGTDKLINKPGLTWETGRMPSIESLYGGATVAKLADYVIVLARDTTSADDFTFRTTRVKFIKTRLRKKNAQIEFKLIYDTQSGRLRQLTD